MTKNKQLDPIPEQFDTLEEASDFWDTHDVEDYAEYLRPVAESLEIASNLPQAVLVERSLLKELKGVARRRGISLETLVNLWLKEMLGTNS
jgi:hypothetical protein